MRIGLLKETQDARVGLVPETVIKLIREGHEVLVEDGAGESAFSSNQSYQDAGASIHSRADVLSKAELLVSIDPPSNEELDALKSGTKTLAMFLPLIKTELADKIKALDIEAYSMDRIPRTTIAQSMDVLSSMASLAGYKAVLVAANHLPSYFPMLMTAAGTIPPAKVLILGAGVAGLQAIATARRLGATVEAFDVRAAAREEVESLGAKFVVVEGAQDDADAGGYAVQQSEEYLQKQRELIHEKASKAHVIITTANIPGRKSPILVENRTVEAMQPGSVIVDLAAANGGNCELTENGKVVQKFGITIVGDSNLPASMPADASKLYSNNVFNFVKYVFKEEGVDDENEIVQGTLIR
ncbi:MAG: NAD(P) transhydrogenase subunit alpha [Bacteroidota bacterium]